MAPLYGRMKLLALIIMEIKSKSLFLVNQTTPFIEICSIENLFLIYFVVVVLDGPVFMLASHISLIGLKRTLANNEVQKLIH